MNTPNEETKILSKTLPTTRSLNRRPFPPVGI